MKNPDFSPTSPRLLPTCRKWGELGKKVGKQNKAKGDFNEENQLQRQMREDRYGHIAKNNVTFDYQIHSGRGGESNALALLSVFDFSEEIIKDANTYLEYRL